MIDRLVANILPPDPAIAPVVSLDPRSRILTLARAQDQEWPYGLDLGARLLLDFDSEWRLARLDLLIPPSQWQPADLTPPFSGRQGVLALNAMPMQRISCPLTVTAQGNEQALLLSWGPAEASAGVRLSPQAIALLAGSLWVGLYLEGF